MLLQTLRRTIACAQIMSHCIISVQEVTQGTQFHQLEQVLITMLVVAALAGQKRSRRDEADYDDGFVVDDNEEEDWRQALKSVTRYDPSKYALSLLAGTLFGKML